MPAFNSPNWNEFTNDCKRCWPPKGWLWMQSFSVLTARTIVAIAESQSAGKVRQAMRELDFRADEAIWIGDGDADLGRRSPQESKCSD